MSLPSATVPVRSLSPLPPRFAPQPWAMWAWIAVAIGLIELACVRIAWFTPVDVTLGVVQKIFYFHVGSAFALLLAMSTGAALSALDLWQPSDRVDAAARAALEVGALFGAMVLLSGPLWARKSWGAWWTWEPRLTLTLLVELLAIAVLMIRGLAADAVIGRRVGAAMAVLAGPAAALIHLAVRLWGGNHPQVLQGGGIQSVDMRVTFWIAVAGLLTLAGLLATLRYRGHRLVALRRGLELALEAEQLRARRARAARGGGR